MAGVQDTNTIDLVARAADGEVILALVEERPWDADPRQPDDLHKKLETYATYVAGGQLERQYPELAGRAVRIQIDCPEQPTAEVERVIEGASAALAQLGIRIVLNVRGY